MAKNTSSSAFRKIDVDQYNEDNFREDDADQASGMIGRNIDALKTVLQNAPLLCKNQQVKDNALNLTLKVLLSIKSSQIDAAIDSLDDPELWDRPSADLAREGVRQGGVGSIVRVLSDSARA
ncbi:hypothetical protein quinque_010024 [Culex quinquefasciatus]